MVILEDLRSAQTRLSGIILRTPLIEFNHSDPTRRLFLKPLNQQPIGAFKLRGALQQDRVPCPSRSPQARRHHLLQRQSRPGRGLRRPRKLGVKVSHRHGPTTLPPSSARQSAALGADIRLPVGPGSTERQLKAEESRQPSTATSSCLPTTTSTSSQRPSAPSDSRFPKTHAHSRKPSSRPVGGGCLHQRPRRRHQADQAIEVNVFGVEPELAADAQASLRAGKIMNFPADQVTRTLADGLRTQSVGPINFDHMQCFVDGIVTVTEDEIAKP